jgi:ABC-type multidrug transport system ATPase subunit
MNVPDRRNRIENDLEALLKLMGLHNVSKTQVGNDYIRGVSGGERRRVTLAEAMVTRAG